MTVRTRFAPSPTGFLHIGGVRTALFNWLLARQAGGQFILRIDDTDATRNQEETLKPILDGFKWLGLDWDEGPEVGGPYAPYFQSERNENYQAAVEQLLNCGAAYRDFAKPEEYAELRDKAREEKKDFIYDRRWMAESPEDIQRFESEGRKSIVRLKMPREGNCEFTDAIRGDVKFAWAGEQDHVIQRDDGTFIYHLASVVDDEEFKITHVVRAIEHLPNTPRQIFIAQSLGYNLPVYAHIPFVAEPGSQNKLSKRKIEKYLKNPDFKKLCDHGNPIADRLGLTTSAETFNPVLVEFYQLTGFQPDAVLNYLLLLGWSLDDRTEHFTRDEMIKAFSLERIVKSPASFDPAKLTAFEHHYFNHLSAEEKLEQVLPFLATAKLIANPDDVSMVEKIKAILQGAEDRLVIAGDIYKFDYFFVNDDALQFDEKAFEKRLLKPDDATRLLEEYKIELEALADFNAASIDGSLHAFVDTKQIEIGQIIHALRLAVTGQASGFGLFETMSILGKVACIKRIDYTINKVSQSKQTSS